jgi:hypothetical protein
MRFIITIDTEEDQWSSYKFRDPTVNNVERLPQIQKVFHKHRVKPTYLVNYLVAADKRASAVIKELSQENGVEIGSHCHPWNTPPLRLADKKGETILCNLPRKHQYEKLHSVETAIKSNINVKPVSFRAGRWGFSHKVAHNLLELDYEIDTSITPMVDWTFCGGPNYSMFTNEPFRYFPTPKSRSKSNKYLLEVPATIGFNRRYYRLGVVTNRTLMTKPLRIFKLKGLLHRARIFQTVWLSPEQSSFKQIKNLLKVCKYHKLKCVNLSFHSSSLVPGSTPFVRNQKDFTAFVDRIDRILSFVNSEKLKPSNLKEFSYYLVDEKLIERRGSLTP